jgi:hypothetical protein
MVADESANLRADRAARLGSGVDVGEAGVGRCVVVAAFAYSASEGDRAGAAGARHGGVCSPEL